MSGCDVLVTGAGAVGGHAVEFLARRPEIRRMAVVDLRADVAQGVAWRARLGALQEDRNVSVEGFGLDLSDIGATRELIERLRPRVVLHAATLLTVPEMARGLSPEDFARVRADGMGGFLAAHILLAKVVQSVLDGMDIRIPMITAPFPDFTNQVLARTGTAPITGIGNVDNIACEIQAIVAEKLGVSSRDVTPMIVAHHSVGEWFQRSGSAGDAPWFARVMVDGKDVSERFDLTALMSESSARIRPVPQEQRTAASGVKAVLAVLRDEGRYLHSAGPCGRAGGWPARLWADRLELVDVPGLDLARAEAINNAGQLAGGIEAIEPDGTLVATARCRTMMRDLFGVEVGRVTPDAIEPTARALRRALSQRIAA
ncbi:Malate/lactate dehydrogenase [Faunimonas pinastri]|uniref:Malate/lactate dehydrogenase n=1 Tax=Faunimonas pinastri TaxID=1855383 RepID=A0A1H9E8I9_9HYPH|nr:NAD-dependent epimerase/dehydratase family protein [Faunimonas pinastri]SEQ21937.1 Malate/lactate dehydrogenase [Faunimonas pinastri]